MATGIIRGRASAHRLTPAGRELRRRLADAQRTWLETVLARFDDSDRRAFADLLGRFVADVERAQQAEPGVTASDLRSAPGQAHLIRPNGSSVGADRIEDPGARDRSDRAALTLPTYQ